ncbi:hypothetical protein GH714_040209 [Hevea brasiliensis]|uniref:Uncharacterized protein n=1 Tax=Hevea brasiliensis TaxID=3981 RepID=A0A6A6MPJ5_HEVBR|nr:hypothetical protein GH714_040209 [Hevea brasiliensis]
MNGGSRVGGSGGGGETGAEWELRPGGMLVQKRNPDSDRSSIPPPTIRVRVKGVEENVDRADRTAPSRPKADLQRQGEGFKCIS